MPIVVIVWGAPGAGKTTYVRKHMTDGDLVVDLDFIKQAISLAGKTEASDDLLPIALSVREHLYELIEYRDVSDWITVWIVAGLPENIQREHLFNRLRADDIVHIDTPMDECIRRALADPERADETLHMRIEPPHLRW